MGAKSVNCRLATEEDYPGIRRLIRFAMADMKRFGQPDLYPIICQLASDGIQRGEAVFVAESSLKELVACVIWVAVHDGVVETGLTYVLDHYRHQGLATHLRELAIDHARKLGHNRVEGIVRSGNDHSERSLLKIGFREAGKFYSLQL